MAETLAAEPQAPAAADTPLARLYGSPLLDLPHDLYIPPDALELVLEVFEGPLDLLLYLIRRKNFNILDIPMAEVTAQYLRYIEEIQHQNLELAADYLLMAAMLIDIKSRMLLPMRPKEGEAEPEDPRAELARRLLEYEQFKLAGRALDARPQVGRDLAVAQVLRESSRPTRLPSVQPEDLRQAWLELMRRARLVTHHRISREALSVRGHMALILRQLREVPYLSFQGLMEEAMASGGGLPVVIVHFLALLGLTREGLVDLVQAAPFAPIYLCLLGESPSADDPPPRLQ